MVRLARELHSDVASGKEAKQIHKLGEHYKSVEETLDRIGYAPNRSQGQRGQPLRQVA